MKVAPPRKTPAERPRRRLRGALLLFGGALLSVCLFFASAAFRPVFERASSAVPEDAFSWLALSKNRELLAHAERLPEDWARALGAVRRGASPAANELVLFLRREEGELLFGFLTSSEVDLAALPRGYSYSTFDGLRAVYRGAPAFREPSYRFYLLDRSLAGWGETRDADEVLPVKAALEESGEALRLTIGKKFRGMGPGMDRPAPRPSIAAFPENSVFYFADLAHPRTFSSILERAPEAARGGVEDISGVLVAMKGPAETLFLRSEDGDGRLVATLKPRFSSSLDELDRAIRAYLGRKDPERLHFLLPDGSTSTEFRDARASIKKEEGVLVDGAKIESYRSIHGRAEFHKLTMADGRVWIATDKPLLSRLLLASVGGDRAGSPSICRPDGRFPGFVLFPGTEMPLSSSFERVTFLLQDHETGLFTICGYF